MILRIHHIHVLAREVAIDDPDLLRALIERITGEAKDQGSSGCHSGWDRDSHSQTHRSGYFLDRCLSFGCRG
jgi:hypothetical protein